MTIIASVKVRDGLILATDTMSHIYGTADDGSQQFMKAYENAHKLLQVGDLPMGVMSYGLGNIGQRSVEGLMLDFAGQVGARRRVEAVTDRLFEFMSEKYNEEFAQAAEKPEIGFFVAGYSPSEPFPEEREFVLPRDPAPIEARPPEVFGASWRGIDFPFVRLWKGFDPRIPDRLAGVGITPPQAVQALQGLDAPVLYDGMPVQDAINFATYILRVTIGYTEFTVGVPMCGGPLQVATLLADTGFDWIERPDLRVSPP